MKILRNLLATIALVYAATTGANEKDGKELVGHFISLDRSVPGCGILFVGSAATFVSDGDHQAIPVIVPCIEMNMAKNVESGVASPLVLHKQYRILVSPVRPKNLSSPPAAPGLLYLIEVREISSQRPNNSFKPTPLRGAA